MECIRIDMNPFYAKKLHLNKIDLIHTMNLNTELYSVVTFLLGTDFPTRKYNKKCFHKERRRLD